MRSREIRSSFLEYFTKHGHAVVPSSSLVPHDDPTLLFTNAGMNQFKDTFLGKETRPYSRAASSQKCMRVSGKHNDLDNVGPSLRHHTFFEMLGNFSFGDYFKQDAIPLAWTLLTDVWHLPKDRLFPTIFKGDEGVPRDDHAFEVWRKLLPVERIGELGAADNFWSMGETGPCGRCSEIYYFRGADLPCVAETLGKRCRGVECDCDRYIEIWNNVFMEFDRQADGALNPLPAPSIDTGMGLERITAVVQNKLSNYDTDLFTPILGAIARHAGLTYTASVEGAADVSMRVIADHLRAMTFLISDGVVPSNEWRGYVLRKIMRRAMRHGKKLGYTEPVLHALVNAVVNEMGEAYPDVNRNREAVVRVVRSEEERFDAVLTAGLPRLEEVLDRTAAGNGIVPGYEAFKLYDSLGVPLDFIEDLASQRGLALDREGYERAMEGQRVKARAGSSFKGGDKGVTFALTPERERAFEAAGDVFEGYESTSVSGVTVLGLFDESGRPANELGPGARGYVAITKTPFYGESGGQVSDAGRLIGAASEAAVDRIVKQGGSRPRLHHVHVNAGALRAGDIMTAEVTDAVRDSTRRNHTATHLLHAALRQLLGSHVKQAGSLVAPDRLRFDFVHFTPLTRQEIDATEGTVNAQIVRNTNVTTEVRSTEQAMAAGAMALFGEKYGDRVRVVSVPGFSMELCGGTHVRATGDIGAFVITEEAGVAAGVRRVEALTGSAAIEWIQHQREQFGRLLGSLNTTSSQAVESVQRLQSETKRLAREVEQLKMKLALGGGPSGRGADEPQLVDGVKLLTKRVSGLEKSALRGLSDTLRDRLGSGVVVIASETDGKVGLVISVSKDLTGRVRAGDLVKALAPIVGGGGGGRQDFAEAGGKDPSRIDDLLATAASALGTALARQPQN
ncbi:MAG: alanine--tRNA ligase [Acidobacteria bacterium]|nr:alanine--tRNA ligase [Acidobacteriota bacterium]